MTVFISHAAADAGIAQELEKFLERRGQFVETDDGQTAQRPLQHMDVAILLISQQLVMSPFRLRLEQRALDAWADGRLILIKLDHAFAPVGLRDLPTIDASFAAQREFKWNEVAQKIRERLSAPLPEPAPPSGPAPQDGVATGREIGGVPAPAARKGGGGWLGGLFTLILILPGLAALVVGGAIWLANRIGPTPGGLPELRAGLDAFGARYGVPQGSLIAAGAVGLMLVVLLFAIGSLFRKRAPASRPVGGKPAAKTAPAKTEAPNGAPNGAPNVAPSGAPSGTADPDAIFVSYARANQAAVLPVIDAVKKKGKRFWVDQQNTKAGDGWAGDIVRAIRGAPEVLVMCSRAAFESDHVKREVYLADRYKKKLVPVFMEDAQPPEDFEYFFAGVQFLKLFETPEAERAAALMRALEAA